MLSPPLPLKRMVKVILNGAQFEFICFLWIWWLVYLDGIHSIFADSSNTMRPYCIYINIHTYTYIMMCIYIYKYLYTYLFLDLVGLQSAKVLSILHSGNFHCPKIVPSIPPKRTTDSTRKMGFASVQGPKVSRQSRLCVFLQLPQNSHFFCLNKKPNNFFTLSSGWPRLLSSNV